MEPGGFSLLESGIWIIPLAILGVMVATFVWIRTLQRGTRKELAPILGALQNYRREIRNLEVDTQAYSRVDEEPFGSRAAILEDELTALKTNVDALFDEYVDLQAQTRQKNLRTWQIALGSIFFWYDWFRLKTASRALRTEVATLEAGLQRLRTRHRELQRMAWTVALRVRSVVRQADDVQVLLDHLSDRRFYGDQFEALCDEIGAIQESLAEIDEDFLTQDEATILSQVDKGDVAATFALLEVAQPRLGEVKLQLGGMKQAYSELEGEVHAMSADLRDLGLMLERMPENLDVGAGRDQLRSMEMIAETIRSTMKRLEIESLDEIAHQTETIRSSARQILQELQTSRKELDSFEEILERLHDRQMLLLAQLESLAQKERHPVEWVESLTRARAINTALEMLGPIELARTPEQIGAQIETAGELLPEQTDLLHHCSQTAEYHAALLSHLDEIGAEGSLAWLSDAHGLAARVARYAEDNWPAVDDITRLPDDVEVLEGRLRAALENDAARAVSESELPDKVENLASLLNDLERLQSRLGRIEQRLDELKSREEGAWEQLEQAWFVISQLDGLASGNGFLEKLAGRQIEKYQDALGELRDAFKTSIRGSIERKSTQAENLVAEIERSATGWHAKLHVEVEALKDELAAKLDTIRSMADLDDREIERAEKTLEADAQASLAAGALAAPDMEGIVPAMKRRNDVWQDLNIALKSIGEKIEAPLLAAYDQAAGQRKEAKGLLAQAGRLILNERTWPPSSLEIHTEKAEFERLEATWDDLPEQRAAVIWIVQRYNELSGSYRSLADRLRQITLWVRSEQERVGRLDSEIDRNLKSWRELERKHSAERLVSSRIRKLREDAEDQRGRIQRRWRLSVEDTPRAAAFDQAVEALQNLAHGLSTAVIRVGSEAEGWKDIQLNTDMGDRWSVGE